MISHSLPLPIVYCFLAVVGAFIGRFLNICIRRFPQHETLGKQLKSVMQKQTVCIRCHARPSFVERIPILGWFLSGRRCHACHSLVSAEQPVVEILTAALFVIFYWFEVPVGDQATVTDTGLLARGAPPGPGKANLWEPVVWFHARYALHMLMVCGLIVATGIDRKLRIIPDGCTVPVMIVAIIASGFFGQLFLVPIWFQDASMMRQLNPIAPELLRPLFVPMEDMSFIQEHTRLHGLAVSVVGALVGAGSVGAVRVIGSYVLKQEAMGMGDVILMGMIGSVIGWQPVLAVFLFAPMLAIAISLINWLANNDKHIPYGPFLSAATVLLLLTWPVSWPFAQGFFDMGPAFVVMLIFMLVFLAASLQLIQIVKRIFGWDLVPDDEDEWPPADQLMYQSQERPDEQTGQWEIRQWPGSRSGRGLLPQRVWKRPGD